MERYALESNEVVLLEEPISVAGSGAYGRLLLTNRNIVVVAREALAAEEDAIAVDAFPIKDIKVYNDAPQITQRKENVTVSFTSGELSVRFGSALKASKFVGKIKRLVTGKGAVARGAGKVKHAIGLVDDTLGINTVGAISGVLGSGVGKTLLMRIGKPRRRAARAAAADTIVAVAKATSTLIQAAAGKPAQPTQQPAAANEPTYEQRVESVKKFRELLDMGIVSQEEFEAKKKELLGL